MTITEAAACGTPAVATRIAGHADAVVHERTGLLVDDPIAAGRRDRARDRRRRRSARRCRPARSRTRRGSPGARPHAARSRCWPTRPCGAAGREQHVSARPAEPRPSRRPTGRPNRSRAAGRGPRSATCCSRSPRTCRCCAAIRARSRPTRSSTSTSIPDALLSRAVSMWDPHIGMGTVTHQNIGYVFPMGPYYWILDKLGVPDWVAQRLWLGSILFFAGARRALPAPHVRPPRAGRGRRRGRVHVHAVHARLLGADLGAAAAVRGAAVADRPHAQGAPRRRLALSRRSSRSSCR